MVNPHYLKALIQVTKSVESFDEDDIQKIMQNEYASKKFEVLAECYTQKYHLYEDKINCLFLKGQLGRCQEFTDDFIECSIKSQQDQQQQNLCNKEILKLIQCYDSEFGFLNHVSQIS